ncbi:hypothetical protein KKI17_02490 [Patescibacteria group bacterium]|nr:hypothetical protein [Patescibacteria group bacterium]
MGITDRQKEILGGAVEAYIRYAEPVSSQFLEDSYELGVSPATIRNELFELTLQGYLSQPYVSSGRVPTDKGYRFYVDEVLERGLGKPVVLEVRREAGDDAEFVYGLLQELSAFVSGLVLAYVGERQFLWKEGWERVLGEPEFAERSMMDNFLHFLRDVESGMGEVKMEQTLEVYIGGENPFSRVRDFSIMVAECRLPGSKKSIVALVGPKRMHYEKNLRALRSLNSMI